LFLAKSDSEVNEVGERDTFVFPKQIAWFSERNFPFVISSFIHSHNVEFPTKTKQNVEDKDRGLFIGHSTLHFQ